MLSLVAGVNCASELCLNLVTVVDVVLCLVAGVNCTSELCSNLVPFCDVVLLLRLNFARCGTCISVQGLFKCNLV